ncbi:MAG TPA: hypothetical protein VJN69_05830 [Candidatus Acidoferrales bacterium]|nr:hypothetical protein [Candidatus Acidoferrales bacterium]
MKSLALCFVFIFAASVTPAADVPALNGSWQVHIVIGSYDSVIVCNFTQKADTLTGTCGTPDNDTAPLTGTVEGEKVAWSYKTTYEGGPVTPTYQGTLDSTSKPAKMTGTIDVPELAADGGFTATPSPQ